MILAADALSRTTPGNGIFRELAAPIDITDGFACDCVGSRR